MNWRKSRLSGLIHLNLNFISTSFPFSCFADNNSFVELESKEQKHENFKLDFFPPSHDGKYFWLFVPHNLFFREQTSQVSRSIKYTRHSMLVLKASFIICRFVWERKKEGVDFVELYNGDLFKCSLVCYLMLRWWKSKSYHYGIQFRIAFTSFLFIVRKKNPKELFNVFGTLLEKFFLFHGVLCPRNYSNKCVFDCAQLYVPFHILETCFCCCTIIVVCLHSGAWPNVLINSLNQIIKTNKKNWCRVVPIKFAAKNCGSSQIEFEILSHRSQGV